MAQLDHFNRPRGRVIDGLRKQFGGAWHYDRDGHEWRSSHGWSVTAEAHWTPRYEGDDDNFTTRYRRSDTGALVWP